MGREAGEEGLSGKFRCLVGLCTRMNGQTPDFGGNSLILLIVVDFIGFVQLIRKQTRTEIS